MDETEAVPEGRVPELIGKRMPSLAGRTLIGENLRVPEDLEGEPALLLITYAVEAQPDVEQWWQALEARASGLAVYQISPRRGLMTSRPGAKPTAAPPLRDSFDVSLEDRVETDVPERRRARVMTLYQTGARLRGAVGNLGPVTHAVLLDVNGVAAWAGRRGFSETALNDLLDALRNVSTPPAAVKSLAAEVVPTSPISGPDAKDGAAA
jgi:hypothetical protein